MYQSIDSTRVINLKILSLLGVNDKLYTREAHFSVCRPPWSRVLGRLYRAALGESSQHTLDSIQALINGCVGQKGVPEAERVRLAIQFRGVWDGLNNLRTTYRDDSVMVAGLEHVMEVLEQYMAANGVARLTPLTHTVDDVVLCELESLD